MSRQTTVFPSISRRNFLKASGAFVVGFELFGSRIISAAVADPFDAEPDVTSLDSWLAVASDESITFFTCKVDLGTGVLTSLSQIVAEELDVLFSRIHMETGDTAHTIDQSQTSGSRTLHKAGPQLRQAAAAARHYLLRMASDQLKAPIGDVVVRDGVVSVPGSRQSVSYGQLIGGKPFNAKINASGTGADLRIAEELPAKNPRDYTIVGTPVPRVDLPGKFTGEFRYSQDVRLPGMLHGRAIRPPIANAKLLSVDESSIAGISGIVKIVREGDFVGVVAGNEWSAIQAAEKLAVKWSESASKLPSNSGDLFEHLKNGKSYKTEQVVDKGNVERGFAGAAKTFEATFRWPFQMHGMMGPSCAVADVQDGHATVWTGSQNSFGTRKGLAALLKLPEQSVRVIYVEGSGCYGRLCADDVPEDAALLSRAVGKPVRVQWSRRDEHAWEPKGPAQLLTVRAAMDAQNRIVAWDFSDRSFPWTSTGALPNLASMQSGIAPSGPGTTGSGSGFVYGVSNGGDFYELDNQRIVIPFVPWIQNAETPLRTNNLRAPGCVARCFAAESLMDEMAYAASADPVEFRLRHLGNDKRKLEVVQSAARQASWKFTVPSAAANRETDPIAKGRGVAVANRDGTVVAALVDVQVERSTGKIQVTHVTIAHDCGLIVNPDGLRNQIEGNVIQGVSRALYEEVLFDETGVTNLDWNEYPVVRFNAIPSVDIVLINRPELGYLGAGEAAIVPIPAAIANALFDATGARVREVPLTPERVLQAMKSSPSRNS